MSGERARFTNARLVLADRVAHGSLVVEDGLIARVAEDDAASPGEDFAGDYLIPGLVELHTDHLESHYAPRPGVRWNPIAAVQAHDAQIAASGITTVLDALRVGTDDGFERLGGDMRLLAEAIAKAKREDRLRADHLLHLRCEVCTADVVAAVEGFLDERDIRLVSLMDHTPGQRQFVRIEKYKEYYQGKLGLSDAEMAAFIAERKCAHERYARANRATIVAQCRVRGIALASHDDATADHVDEAVRDGVAIAEFPTTLEAAEGSRARGLRVLMGAPNVVRGGSHSGNASAADLAARGLLDILSSDYVPFSLLHAAFLLPEQVGDMELPAAVALVTSNPAMAVGLADRGAIAEGLRADLVRVSHVGGVPVVRAVWREGRRVA